MRYVKPHHSSHYLIKNADKLVNSSIVSGKKICGEHVSYLNTLYKLTNKIYTVLIACSGFDLPALKYRL